MDDATSPIFIRPVKGSLGLSFCGRHHWRCLILSAFMTGCFSTAGWCAWPILITISQPTDDGFVEYRQSSSVCTITVTWIPAAIGLLFYIVYLIDCYQCSLARELCNLMDQPETRSLVTRWQKARPVIRWRAIGYHYETAMRQYYRGNGGENLVIGNVQHRRGSQFSMGSDSDVAFSHAVHARVDTSSSDITFAYNECGYYDQSATILFDSDDEQHPLSGAPRAPTSSSGRYSFVVMNVRSKYLFACSCAESLYWQQRSSFLMRHRYSDEYLETRETYAITGTGGGATSKTLYIVADKSRPPLYLRRHVFWALCFIGLAWPVRLFIESQKSRIDYTIMKKFGQRCCQDNGEAVSSQSLRDHGTSSTSMEKRIQSNLFAGIPTYSEALLMKPQDGSYGTTFREGGLLGKPGISKQSPGGKRIYPALKRSQTACIQSALVVVHSSCTKSASFGADI